MSKPGKYVAPHLEREAFNCPHCGVFAKQRWRYLAPYTNGTYGNPINGLRIALCEHCPKFSIWNEDKMVIPDGGVAPLPNPDLPEDLVQDYEEARAIVSISPRGAAALLRLVIQKLIKHLGEPGKNINDDIGALVRKGLPGKVREALDSVRVIGNDAVHPGTIDLNDQPEMASALFGLVNFIVEKMISEPKEIDGIYSSIPIEKRAAIERRDKIA